MADVNTCRCIDPQLFRDRLDNGVRCYSCGSKPRTDLGKGRDPLERVRYRARFNKLYEEAADVERARSFERITDRQAGREYRGRRAREMRDDGFTIEQIAAALRVSTTTVKYWTTPGYREIKRAASEKWNTENPEKRAEAQRKANAKRRRQQCAHAKEWAERNPARKRLHGLKTAA